MRRLWKLACRGLLLLLGVNFLVAAWAQWGVVHLVLREGVERQGVVLEESAPKDSRQPLLATTGSEGQPLQVRAITLYGPGMAPEPGASLPIRLLEQEPPRAVIDSFWGRYGIVVLYGLLGLFGLVAGLTPPRRSAPDATAP